MTSPRFPFFEFFAGGGMARLGLGDRWTCAFSNDICEKKAAAYRGFFGESPELLVRDVATITPQDLPGIPTLVWASFPCQDLSLAGSGAGLKGERSGTFGPFWKLVQGLIADGRVPKLIVLENVVGAITSKDGKDFRTIFKSLTESGYQVGPLVMDAVRFLPQSRPRLFLVGVHRDTIIPPTLYLPGPAEPWHTTSLRAAYKKLPKPLKKQFVWWHVPTPTDPVPEFTALIEDEPSGVAWHTPAQTKHIIELMSPLHRERLASAMRTKKRIVGTIYRRMRPDENGKNIQRAEVRFDQISGCLRTPVGGSSRQTIIVAEGDSLKSRLLSPREAARLMGVPDSYPLPRKYNDAYHVFGDGLAVPVVAWLEKHLLHPLALSEEVGQISAQVA